MTDQERYQKKKLQCLVYAILLFALAMPGVTLKESSLFPLNLSSINFKIILIFFITAASYHVINFLAVWENIMLPLHKKWKSSFPSAISSFDEAQNALTSFLQQLDGSQDRQIPSRPNGQWLMAMTPSFAALAECTGKYDKSKAAEFVTRFIGMKRSVAHSVFKIKKLYQEFKQESDERFNMRVKSLDSVFGMEQDEKRDKVIMKEIDDTYLSLKRDYEALLKSEIRSNYYAKNYLRFREFLGRLNFWTIEFLVPVGIFVVGLFHAIGKIWPTLGLLPNLPKLLVQTGLISH